MKIEFKDVCTNLRHYNNFDYQNYGMSKAEAEAILQVDDDSETLCQIRDLVSKTDYDERNDLEHMDYRAFYEAVKEIVG